MTWIDGLALGGIAGAMFYEMRQEAGKGLLHTLVTLAAVHLSTLPAALLTRSLGLSPFPGTEISPHARIAAFLLLWGLGLLAAGALHRQLRWSAEPFDPLCGLLFGLFVALAAGHVVSDGLARISILEQGSLPAWQSGSLIAPELSSFRSYHAAIDLFRSLQYGP